MVPRVITICRRQSTQWRKVSENVFIKGQANNTLSSYFQIGVTTCMNCYNRIIVNVSSEFQQHIQAGTNYKFEETVETDEAENINAILCFSQAIAIIQMSYIYTRK